jgi:hypothetical protein
VFAVLRAGEPVAEVFRTLLKEQAFLLGRGAEGSASRHRWTARRLP